MKRTINKAYLVLVALDDDDRPTEVPGLILETDEDKMGGNSLKNAVSSGAKGAE